MRWDSEEGQKVLAVAYALQNNFSNAVSTPKERMGQLVGGKVYGRYNYEKGRSEYSLQPFEKEEQGKAVEGRRIVSKGRKPIEAWKIDAINEMYLQGFSEREIAKELKVGKGTVGKYLKF